jgi:hypothetical protein
MRDLDLIFDAVASLRRPAPCPRSTLRERLRIARPNHP